MPLREKVIVKTATADLQGELFVGADGLPELTVQSTRYGPTAKEVYRPWTLPKAWTVFSAGAFPEVLLDAWRIMDRLHQDIRDAQREAEAEDRDRAQQRELDARTAQEIDERRACDA